MWTEMKIYILDLCLKAFAKIVKFVGNILSGTCILKEILWTARYDRYDIE